MSTAFKSNVGSFLWLSDPIFAQFSLLFTLVLLTLYDGLVSLHHESSIILSSPCQSHLILLFEVEGTLLLQVNHCWRSLLQQLLDASTFLDFVVRTLFLHCQLAFPSFQVTFLLFLHNFVAAIDKLDAALRLSERSGTTAATWIETRQQLRAILTSLDWALFSIKHFSYIGGKGRCLSRWLIEHRPCILSHPCDRLQRVGASCVLLTRAVTVARDDFCEETALIPGENFPDGHFLSWWEFFEPVLKLSIDFLNGTHLGRILADGWSVPLVLRVRIGKGSVGWLAWIEALNRGVFLQLTCIQSPHWRIVFTGGLLTFFSRIKRLDLCYLLNLAPYFFLYSTFLFSIHG